jgi:hypothetical protein
MVDLSLSAESGKASWVDNPWRLYVLALSHITIVLQLQPRTRLLLNWNDPRRSPQILTRPPLLATFCSQRASCLNQIQPTVSEFHTGTPSHIAIFPGTFPLYKLALELCALSSQLAQSPLGLPFDNSQVLSRRWRRLTNITASTRSSSQDFSSHCMPYGSEGTENFRKGGRFKIKVALGQYNYRVTSGVHPGLRIADDRKQAYVDAVDAVLWDTTQDHARYNISLKRWFRFVADCKDEHGLPVPDMNSFATLLADNNLSMAAPPAPPSPQPNMSTPDTTTMREFWIMRVLESLRLCNQQVDIVSHPSLHIPKDAEQAYANAVEEFIWGMAKKDRKKYKDAMDKCVCATLNKCSQALNQEHGQDVSLWANFLSQHFPDKGHTIAPVLTAPSTDPTSVEFGAANAVSTDVDAMDTDSPVLPSMDKGSAAIDRMDISPTDPPPTDAAPANIPSAVNPAQAGPSISNFCTASTSWNLLPAVPTPTNTVFTNTAFLNNTSNNTKTAHGNSMDIDSIEVPSANETFEFPKPISSPFKYDCSGIDFFNVASNPARSWNDPSSGDEPVDEPKQAPDNMLAKRKLHTLNSPPAPAASVVQHATPSLTSAMADGFSVVDLQRRAFKDTEDVPKCPPSGKLLTISGNAGSEVAFGSKPAPAAAQFNFGVQSAPIRSSMTSGDQAASTGFNFKFGSQSATTGLSTQNAPISATAGYNPKVSNPFTQRTDVNSLAASSTSTTPKKTVAAPLPSAPDYSKALGLLSAPSNPPPQQELVEGVSKQDRDANTAMQKHLPGGMGLGAAPRAMSDIVNEHANSPSEKPTSPRVGNNAPVKPQVSTVATKHAALAEPSKECAAAEHVTVEVEAAAPTTISPILEAVAPSHSQASEGMDNAASEISVVGLVEAGDATTQPAVPSQMQFMKMFTMMEALQTSQQKTQQAVQVILSNDQTHRDRHETQAEEMADLKLQVQHDREANAAAQEESARKVSQIEQSISALIKTLSERNSTPAAVPKEDFAKSESLKKTISDQEEIIKSLKDGKDAATARENEYGKRLEGLDEIAQSQTLAAKELADRTNALSGREEAVKSRELTVAAKEEALKKRELAVAAQENVPKKREQAPKSTKIEKTAVPQAVPTKAELTVQSTTVPATSSTALVLAPEPESSKALVVASKEKTPGLAFFSARALENGHLAFLKTPTPSISTPLNELISILTQHHVPRPLRDRHAKYLLAILTFVQDFDRSTIELPTYLEDPLADWCSKILNTYFKDRDTWLDVSRITILHNDMLLLSTIVTGTANIPSALTAIANEHDVETFANMCKEYIGAGRVLSGKMPAEYEYKRKFEKWVSAEELRYLRGVRRVQGRWMMVVRDDWGVEDEEL